jgi:nucleoporin POM152
MPFEGWLVAIAKVMYDRELSVSERRVKPANIIHNSSLILGKQIIHILPEGFVLSRPNDEETADALHVVDPLCSTLIGSLCLDSARGSIQLPIRINQTDPILIDLLRFDLETNLNETITISAKELRRMKKQADKAHGRTTIVLLGPLAGQ